MTEQVIIQAPQAPAQVVIQAAAGPSVAVQLGLQVSDALETADVLWIPGPAGPAGPAGTIEVGDVVTGAPGSGAQVVNRGTPSAAVLDFQLPLPEAYVHHQVDPSPQWTINHNLGTRPSVELFTSGGEEFDGDVVHLNSNTVIVYLSSPISGFARLT